MWRFVLTDRSFVPVGELLNVYEQAVALPLNRLPTLSFRLRGDHPHADQVFECEGYVKGYYRDATVPGFFGSIVSSEEVGTGTEQQIKVNCVGAGWALNRRLAGKSTNGTPFPPTDRALIFKSLLDLANAEANTGIATDRHSILSGTQLAGYVAGPYKPLSECLTELSRPMDGFDWRINPIENYVGGAVTTTKWGSFEAAPVLGSLRAESVFEYGAGRNNVAGYTRRVNRDEQINRAIHLPSSGAGVFNQNVVMTDVDASISTWGLLEEVVAADLLDTTLRQRLVDEHAAVRAWPRQVVDMTPHVSSNPGVPVYGRDYIEGDFVPVRAVNSAGSIRIDSTLRIWGVAFQYDDKGTETVTLTLAEET